MQLYVKVVPLSAGTSQPAGEPLTVPCPPDVEPDTVLSFLTQKFGEPLEVAWTSTDRHPRLATGWIFPGMPATATDPEVEYLCVPHIQTSDGTLHNMFELQADQRQEFEQLAASGAFDSYTVVTAPHRSYQPPSTQAGSAP
jgi:hypothetical protein